MSRVIIYEITGMHCASCERVIDSVLKAVPQVIETEVSLKQQRAAIRLPENIKEPDLGTLNRQLAVHGYQLFPKGERPETCSLAGPKDPLIRRLKHALLALAAVGILALLFAPLRKSVPTVGAGASFGAMFVLGLVASVSTCLASTGGFILAYTSKNPSRLKAMALQFGRLAAFVVGGAALGAVGGSLPQESTIWYGLLALVLGMGFLVVGLNLLELSPSLAKFGVRLPKGFGRLADKVAASKRPVTPFLVGAVTFILPCGFTQTAQALALASGSAQQGLLIMTGFAVGTLPVLLGLSWFGSAAALRHKTLRLATGAALSLFAVGQIDGGLIVLGSPVTPTTFLASLTASRAKETDVPVANAQEQVVKMTVAYGTYEPKNLTVKKGIPVRWEIDGKDVFGCASSLVVPSYGIRKSLKPGLNVVQFTPKEAGVVPFSCAMGMIRGSFTVID